MVVPLISVPPLKMFKNHKILPQEIMKDSYNIPQAEREVKKDQTRTDFCVKKQKPLKLKEFQGFGGDCWTRTSDLLRVKQAL